MARTTLARIVDPQTGAEITEAGVPGELRIKGPGVFPGYLPASGVPDPFDEDGYLRPGTSSRSPATTWSTCSTSTGPRTWWSAAG